MTLNNKSFLSVSEVDYDSLVASLITFLKAQDKFKDYDFDASNIRRLVELLAFNTTLNNLYLNQIGSEMFLDTATLKESIVSIAKELNYIPKSRKSSEAVVIFNLFPSGSPDFITIPKNYRISSSSNGFSYSFLTNDSYVVRRNMDGAYVSDPIIIYEGVLVTERFTAQQNKRYILSSKNIDISSIEVRVNEGTETRTYFYRDFIAEIFSEDRVFFIQGFQKDQYEIIFGKGSVGKQPPINSIIEVTYRDTKGEEANGCFNFKKTSNIDGVSSITLTTIQNSLYGSEREDIESIRFAAPRYYTTQNRAVTAEDFANLTLKQFPQIESIKCFGGENEEPKKYGTVIVSVKPFGTVVVSDSLKNSIKTFLETKTISTNIEVKDPEYFYLGVDSVIYYDESEIDISQEQLKSNVENLIFQYGVSRLNKFDGDFRYSNFISNIDSLADYIISNFTRMTVNYKFSPPLNLEQKYSIDFGNEITSFESTVFTYEKEGIKYPRSFLKADESGNISVLYYFTDSTIVQLQRNVGRVNYSTGAISFTIAFSEYIREVVLTCNLNNKDFIVNRNKILSIDNSRVFVSIRKALV